MIWWLHAIEVWLISAGLFWAYLLTFETGNNQDNFISSAGAYIIVEEKTVWRWQVWRYLRDGWEIVHQGHFRVHLERCIG